MLDASKIIFEDEAVLSNVANHKESFPTFHLLIKHYKRKRNRQTHKETCTHTLGHIEGDWQLVGKAQMLWSGGSVLEELSRANRSFASFRLCQHGPLQQMSFLDGGNF